MNPITRLMKRYVKIKTPLKYGLPLLFVGSLILVSISGCVSTPTASPSPSASSVSTTHQATVKATATPTSTTAGFDPLLTKMAAALSKQYSTTVSKLPKNADQDGDMISISVDGPDGGTTSAGISNYGTTATATGIFNMMATPISDSVSSPASVTHFGQQAATVALGHTPMTINDYYLKGTGNYAGVNNEYIQYDQLFISTTVYTAAAAS